MVDKVLDKIGMKSTSKWTVQQAAELSIAAPNIASSGFEVPWRLEGQRVASAEVFKSGVADILSDQTVDKKLIDGVRQVLMHPKYVVLLGECI